MKTFGQLDYSNVPGIKASLKLFLKSVARKVYLTVSILRVDPAIVNPDGIKGLVLVASYTDRDQGYVQGLVDSAEAFEKIILYHDKTKKYDFTYNESLRFEQLARISKKQGARWVLIGSPKTRFSKEFRSQVAPYIEKYAGQPVVLSMNERYLWENFDQYANVKIVKDGVVIEKLFSITDDMVFDGKHIHATQRPINYETIVPTEASRYYLGRFNLKIMKEKADFYHKKDGKDYSHLYDMTEPKKHHETILGIGEYEETQLMGGNVSANDH